MKVGIDGRLINRHQNTGISRYTEFLLDYYVKKYGKNQVSIISNNHSLEGFDCEVIYTKFKPFNICDFLRYSTFIRGLKFDIFHIPFYSGFFTKLSDVRVIVTVHDLMYKLVPDFFGQNTLVNRLKIAYFDFIVSHTIKTATDIIAVSETTKCDLHHFFNATSTCIPENSEIVGDRDISIIDKLELRERPFFFYCGNNRPHKNIQFLIDFFNVSPDLPPLLLAGKGHKGGRNVIAAGIVSEKELRALYESSIAFIFPSKYEGFGLPILEALSVGKPVVASKIPAFLEFKSKNIFYFDIGDTYKFANILEQVQAHQFIHEDTFFKKYDSKRIYTLLNALIDSVD